MTQVSQFSENGRLGTNPEPDVILSLVALIGRMMDLLRLQPSIEEMAAAIPRTTHCYWRPMETILRTIVHLGPTIPVRLLAAHQPLLFFRHFTLLADPFPSRPRPSLLRLSTSHRRLEDLVLMPSLRRSLSTLPRQLLLLLLRLPLRMC